MDIKPYLAPRKDIHLDICRVSHSASKALSSISLCIIDHPIWSTHQKTSIFPAPLSCPFRFSCLSTPSSRSKPRITNPASLPQSPLCTLRVTHRLMRLLCWYLGAQTTHMQREYAPNSNEPVGNDEHTHNKTRMYLIVRGVTSSLT